MTNQMKVIAVVVIAIVAIGGAAFFLMSNKSQDAQPATVTADLTNQDESSTKASIKSLLGTGKNVTCTVTYPEDNGSGTIFVADKKMRGDFTTTVDTQNMESSMISDGEFMYIWSGKQGTKISLETALEAAASPSPTAQQGTDINEDVDMKCSGWNVDNTKFNVPGDVQFTDVSQFLNQSKPASSPISSGAGLDKSICDQITDPQAKAACLSY